MHSSSYIGMYIVHTFTQMLIHVWTRTLYRHRDFCAASQQHCISHQARSALRRRLVSAGPGASPSEQPSSWYQSFQLTDHPSAAYHAQTATATAWYNQTTDYTMQIHCIYVYIQCIYMYIHCTWVPHIVCIYHYCFCQCIQPWT
jgi:hypothetical protein